MTVCVVQMLFTTQAVHQRYLLPGDALLTNGPSDAPGDFDTQMAKLAKGLFGGEHAVFVC